MNKITPATLNSLVDHLKDSRNFDAEVVGDELLLNIVNKRLEKLALPDVSAYIDYLQVHPSEPGDLISDLIQSQSFGLFDDATLWETLRDHVLSQLAQTGEPLRFWCVGVGRGQSVCALAVTLAELLGIANVQERVKIFATDSEEQALAEARQACFNHEDLGNLADNLRAKYFVPNSENRFALISDLRRQIVFGRHNLLVDPPVSKMDLIICQRILPLLDRHRQHRALVRLQFALKNQRYLVVDRGQRIENGPLFIESQIHASVYSRVTGNSTTLGLSVNQGQGHVNSREADFKDAVFEQGAQPHLLLDRNGIVLMTNASARERFGLRRSDSGRPLQDLEISYRPTELRSLLEQAQAQQKQLVVQNIVRNSPEFGEQLFDIAVRPILDGDSYLGASIRFQDVTAYNKLRDQSVTLNQQLQTANEELQSAHEELETTNEELNSTNEELETTNEELQSTNEELETMNEELRSTNSELEVTNAEQRLLSERMSQTNRFLERILASIQSAVIVLDHRFNIIVWNSRAEEMWGLRADEVIRENFFSLDMGLPTMELKAPIMAFKGSAEKSQTLTTKAINRRGKAIECFVKLAPLGDDKNSGTVLLITEQNAEENGSHE